MDNRNQQVREILLHIDRIETELALLRQAVTRLAGEYEDIDQDLILVDAELVIPQEQTVQSLQAPTENPTDLNARTRREIIRDGRWRAQNWAIRERQSRSERQLSEQLNR
jgi:hypothetical protein